MEEVYFRALKDNRMTDKKMPVRERKSSILFHFESKATYFKNVMLLLP